jgi:hypothetical protein
MPCPAQILGAIHTIGFAHSSILYETTRVRCVPLADPITKSPHNLTLASRPARHKIRL